MAGDFQFDAAQFDRFVHFPSGPDRHSFQPTPAIGGLDLPDSIGAGGESKRTQGHRGWLIKAKTVRSRMDNWMAAPPTRIELAAWFGKYPANNPLIFLTLGQGLSYPDRD